MNKIVSDPDIMGGIYIIAGTRIPVALILAELAEGHSILQVSSDYEIEANLLREVLLEISSVYNTCPK